MTIADTSQAPIDAAQRRAARQLIRQTSAHFAGRKRGNDREVRRSSYDVDDPRAQVWRRIGDGSKRDGLVWVDAMLQTAREFDLHERAKTPGSRGPLSPYTLTVFEALLRRALDFKTGRSEPALLTIMRWTGFAKATVVRALARLRAHGFLDWVRRSRATGNAKEYGPQREQTSNAYFFDPGGMARNVAQRFRDLLARRRRTRAEDSPAGPQAKAGGPAAAPSGSMPHDSTLADALARIGANIQSASS